MPIVIVAAVYAALAAYAVVGVLGAERHDDWHDGPGGAA